MDKSMRAAAVSVASNTMLLTLKLVIGLFTGSVSIISAAADSLNDLAASGIAYLSVRASRVPADTEHPYGHGKVENISGAVQALLIFFAAAYIVYEAVTKIITPRPIGSLLLGIVVMGITSAVDLFVSRYLLRVARETESAAIRADAYHLTTDIWTSLSAMAALILVRLTGNTLFDPVVALLVALMILRVAYGLTHESLKALLDARLPEEEVAALQQIVMATPGVVGLHKLRTRKLGPYRDIDYHLILPAAMPVEEAHAITSRIESRMGELFPRAHVLTHVEPDTPDVVAQPETLTRTPRKPARRRIRQRQVWRRIPPTTG